MYIQRVYGESFGNKSHFCHPKKLTLTRGREPVAVVEGDVGVRVPRAVAGHLSTRKIERKLIKIFSHLFN
jgi:hypothetical protein